jgi:signal transduction histidine kinase
MRLGDFIQANAQSIEKAWEIFARENSTISLSRLMLADHIGEILVAIANDMKEPQSPAEQAAKGKGKGATSAIDQVGYLHAIQRGDVGFRFDQVAAELRALRASIVRLWQESSPAFTEESAADMIRFNEAIDQIMIRSMSAYTQRVDRHRDQVLAIIQHDFRNPLGAIVMSAGSLARTGNLDEQGARTVGRIQRSAKRMSLMLNDLLDLTRSRLGAPLPLELSPTDLGVVGQHIVDELRALHPDRDLHFESSGDLHGEWDKNRLEQVISNLVANALVHGAKAAPVLVTAAPRDGDVTVAVHNEGPAISEADMEKIFDPLVRAAGTGQASHAGSLGLGLFIVRELVKAHGGEVTVTSSAEGGTTFTLRLPRTPPRVA